MNKDFPVSGWTSLAVHGGHKKDPTYAHQVPIYATSTYVYDTAEQGMRRFSGQEEGYIYSRWGNPTFTEAEPNCRVGNISIEFGGKGFIAFIRNGSYLHFIPLQFKSR